MSKMKDLTGKKFNKLTVISFQEIKNKQSYWNCLCDCGNTKIIRASRLKYIKSCGCYTKEINETNKKLNLIDITGKKFNKLTAICYHIKGYWKCKCECGNECIVRGRALRSGKAKSCGCNIRKRKKQSPNWKGCGDMSGTHYREIINGSKRRNIPFDSDLSIEYLWDLFLKQNKKCALSGIPLSFAPYRKNNIKTASLDRINNCEGYIKGNVQWVHTNINLMKNALDQNDFIKLCKQITEYQQKNI